jgi:NAD(P)H-hydrate epimerase
MNILNRLKAFNIKLKMNSFSNSNEVSYINSEQAKMIDEELMGSEIGYSIDQLMEVAGLSVALSIHHAAINKVEFSGVRRILNISGPGSNNLSIKNR